MPALENMQYRILKIKCNLIVFFGVLDFLLLLNIGIVYSQTPTTIGEKGVTLFLCNKTLPPMIYMIDNKPVGIIVDIAEALKNKMNFPVVCRSMNWEQAQQFVLDDKADALFQINPSEERKKIYDFSDSLLESEFSIFVSYDKPGIYDIAGLKGLRVGVEKKGRPLQLLKQDMSIKTVPVVNIINGFNLLKEGKLDAVVVDRWVGSFVLAENQIENIRVTGLIEKSKSAIAVKKGNTKLLEDINRALAEIKEDGTYSEILNRWKRKQIVFRTKDQIFKQKVILAAILCVLSVISIFTVLLLIEINKRKKINAELHIMATTDKLTGVINRRAIESVIDKEMYRKKRYDNPVSLLILDLDHFKEINDQYGHAAGDEVLSKVAETIESSLRSSDKVARWGGEEFVIVAANTNISDALILSHKICKEIESIDFENIRTVTASIGVAEYLSDEDFHQWYQRVDSALYSAKKEGRNRVVVAGEYA